MRVWLVEEKSAEGLGRLESLLRQLEAQAGTGLHLVGASPFQPDFADAMRKLAPDLLDVIVINEPAWPTGLGLNEISSLGVGILIVAAADRIERFRQQSSTLPISFLASKPGVDGLWLGLLTALGSQQREFQWSTQITRLQQRLSDRVIIERAKGILVHRLKISEEDAYKRLRLLSRRQRRQIREIAQSLVDTQLLFSPESNGFSTHELAETEADQSAGRA